MIQKGDFGELLAVKSYTETPLGEKYVVVAYRKISRSTFATVAPVRSKTSRSGENQPFCTARSMAAHLPA